MPRFALAATMWASASLVLAQQIPIPPTVLTRIAEVLPEQSNAGAAFASDSYGANIAVTEACNIDVVFLWEGAGYRNSAGWFTYQEQVDGSVTILDRGLIWPDASMPSPLPVGTASRLRHVSGVDRVFLPGELVGFFVIADGWNREPRVRTFGTATPIPATTPAGNAAIGRGCYTTLGKLNPEFASPTPQRARHVAMIDMPGVAGFLGGERYVMTGFEDLNRNTGSDDDFNDLVFVVQSNPIGAIATEDLFTYEPGDPDGDGVPSLLDHYPNDPARASCTRYPSNGIKVLALEDEYPEVGDADFNDCVVGYVFEVVKHANGNITEIAMTVHLLARGSVHNHGFGLHLPGLPAATTGTVSIERFLADASSTHQLVTRSVQVTVGEHQRRIADLLPYTMQALPRTQPDLPWANTATATPGRPAASARLVVAFASPVTESDIGVPPYDPWFQIHRGGLRDVHLPGYAAFPDRVINLPTELGPASFRDAQGFPFVLEVPTTWQFPLEQVRIEVAYPGFANWRQSAGAQSQSWYLAPSSLPERVSASINQFVPARAWSIDIPR